MLHVFNKQALTKKQRFSKAIVFGVLATIIAVILELVLIKVFHVFFDITYLLIGFGIGYAIQYFGKGVQVQFSILAVVLTLIVILLCDLIVYDFDLSYVLANIASNGTDSLFSLAYRIFALYLAYRYARVV